MATQQSTLFDEQAPPERGSTGRRSMFTDDFFPTPRPVAKKMLDAIEDKDAEYFLEPSAGKGDLAEVIRGERDHYDRYASRRKVDTIESHPELAAILREKGFPVVGYDWLTYSGVCYYSGILMNPPFSEGAKHLLRAWDFMHDGEIVCLLNAETIRNPHTAERKRLMEVISQAGWTKELGQCFRNAQRGSDVEVVMVHLQKKADDDQAELWSLNTTEKKADDWIGPEDAMLAVRDELGNMEHYYNSANEHMLKGFQYLRKAYLYMQANGVTKSDYEKIVGMALGNINSARAEFATHHRRDSWTRVFDKMNFHRWLDKLQTEQLLRDVETNSTIPFTADNIKGTLDNVMSQRIRLFEQSVANVFDELTKYYPGNTNHSEGWKSNSDFKVNQKLVFPYGCHFDDNKSWRSFNLYSYHSGVVDFYHDLDRVLCVLDGKNFEHCWTIARVLRDRFQQLGHHVTAPFDNTCESDFFHIKFWMKGTVHLKWKDRDLWEKFNQQAAAGKKWVGRSTKETD